MKAHGRSRFLGLGLVVVMLALATLACSIGGGDGDEAESDPTLAATQQPTSTESSVAALLSPTPFPTQTRQPLATATPLVLRPANTPLPTWTPFVPTATSWPYDVRISYPVDGSQIAGYVTITGSASHPRFLQYALEWGPEPNPGNLWYPITAPRNTPVLNNILGAWSTTSVPDGQYRLRLHVWLTDGTDTDFVVGSLRVSNRQPTAVPTATATQRVNRIPQISPIANQNIPAGQTTRIPITASDPDADPIILFASSNNPSIATAQVTSTSEITVQGVTAGAAVITVSVNDNQGGAANTSFTVNVTGQNRAPTINPIVNQAVEVGRSVDVTVQAADPDGDTLTVTASSSSAAIAQAAALNANTVRVTGVSEGTANVTVTASDGRGGTVSTVFAVTVGSANQPPALDAIGGQTMVPGETRDIGYNASDPDGDTLEVTATSDSPGVVSASITVEGAIRLVTSQPGSATVTVTADDGESQPVSTSFTVTVEQGNRPPALDPISDQTMVPGETRDIGYRATDPDGDTLNVTAASDNQGVVSASITAEGAIRLVTLQPGSATVTVTADDGESQPASTSFTVTVEQGNQPPTLDAIQAQSLSVGQTIEIMYNALDPDDDPLTASASSDDPAVVTAEVARPGVIALTGQGAGEATVTLSVEDDQNPAVQTSFQVTIGAPNTPPSINPIEAQQLTAGDALDLFYTATDMEGDTLTADVTSSDPNVVAASIPQAGTIHLEGAAAGDATITLTVSDGVNPPTQVQFAVQVAASNQQPSLQPIENQTVTSGETLTVQATAADPDGDPVTLAAVSDNPSVASAAAQGAEVAITGNAPGTATITVDASDERGGTASTTFIVTVEGANNPPVIEPIGDQSLSVGETIQVPIVVTDADNDPIVLTAISQNQGVVMASAVGTDTIVLEGTGEGVATVELTADDARGGVPTATFTVTVSSAGPSFDLNAYPVVPQIDQQDAAMLAQVYQSGASNFGNQAGAFSKVGDQSVASANFAAPYAAEDVDLGNYQSLADLIALYRGTPVREGDGSINSFNVESVAAGTDYGIDSLAAPPPASAPCSGDAAGTALGCEFAATHPSIALVSFSAPNVTFMAPEQFRSELQVLVSNSLSQYGVIPVLATIPAGNGATTEQLSPYNQAIVEVATQSGVPLWNLWRAMQERGISDPFSVAPEGPGVLTDAALSYGYNVRNLTALQTLAAVRQAAGIQ